MYVYVLALHRLKCRRRTKLDFNVLLQVRTPTDVSDDAARLQVQQELADLGPGFVAAVVEVRRDLVVDAVHVLPLELTGSLLHGVRASCSGLTVASFCGENTTLNAHTELINAIAAAFHQASATKSKVDPPTGAAQRCFAARICSEFSLKPLEKRKADRHANTANYQLLCLQYLCRAALQKRRISFRNSVSAKSVSVQLNAYRLYVTFYIACSLNTTHFIFLCT